MSIKSANLDHPIQELLAERWSPYTFSDRPVSDVDLCSLFEAARWAPSSYNEQPWSYIVATKEDPAEYHRLLSCLVEPNQAWAQVAPVLALGVVSQRFKRNDRENRSAFHDLGLASANLSVEATARGLHVHQMIGIYPDCARELYNIPEDAAAWTGLAIGYKADPATGPEALRERDTTPRNRKPLNEFVFTGAWGISSPIVSKP